MQAHMTPAETSLFCGFLRHSDIYLEFGSGGSTCLAAQSVRNHVTAIDSSKEWLERVDGACLEAGSRIKPNLLHVDIGPIGPWGTPSDESARDRWPSYYESVWDRSDSADADLYLIDGRFRVACFIKTLLRCRSDAVILIHDFASRGYYHAIRGIAREIASTEELSAFIAKPGQSRADLLKMLEAYRFQTA